MSDTTRPTIFALSSGRGPAAIAVVRISGSRAGDALKALGVKIPEPRKAGLARVRDPETREIIDEALALWFPGPHSETGEDTAELQLHGGRAVVAGTLAALGKVEGLRPAEAGEFTRRAFENGKLDLTAVEGLADLVGAETEAQRRQAFRQMKGALGQRADSWREKLIQVLALVEARIDFSDEAYVPEDLVQPALEIAQTLDAEIGQALADGQRGERLREGLVVAIAGPPNAGKSTLLNRIARREAAIVSPYAGTTRDVIEVHLDLGGWPVTLLDTAGIRETDDPVEMEGVRRARERASAADLVLWVEDASEANNQAAPDNPATRAESAAKGQSAPAGRAAVTSAAASEAPIPHDTGPAFWLVRSKIDLLPASERNEFKYPIISKNESDSLLKETLKSMVNSRLTSRNEPELIIYEHKFNVSTATGDGFDSLFNALAQFAGNFLAGTESGLITRERHRLALTQAHAALQRALALGTEEDLLAEELRTAATALGRLTGRVDVEDILDVIFRDFCIGK